MIMVQKQSQVQVIELNGVDNIKKLLLTLLLICILTFPAQAMNGHISLEYDTLSKTGQGEIYLYEDFNRLRISGKMQTDLMGFNLKNGYFPAGVPKSQTYDLIVDYKVTDDITVSFIEGCKHYFSQSGREWWDDENYIKIKTKYEF